MTGTTPTTDRIEDIASAIKYFRKTAAFARESANGIFGRWDVHFRERWLKKARIKERAAQRLVKLLAKECDKLKEAFT